MKFASFQALLVGSFLVASSGDASAQWRGGNRGGGGYRMGSSVYGYGQGYGQSYYGNSNTWSYPQSFGNTQWSYGYTPRSYGYTPYYGNGYSNSYYTTPSYSTVGQPATMMQAQYSELSTARQALLSVWVPSADAQVWISGTEMTTRGTERTFAIPPLESGMNYTYTVKARWMAEGRAIEQTRNVSVRAGQQSSVDFRQPDSETEPLPSK